MTDVNRSPLAVQVGNVRDPATIPARTPWGVCLHTTGRGVVTLAARKGRRPIDVALDVYRASQRKRTAGGAHYVIDHDGGIHQLAPDDRNIAHCGSGGARDLYRTPRGADPTWHKRVSLPTVKHWLARWGDRYNDPFDLFPSTSPNADYIGIEMVAVGSGFGAPAGPGLLFTAAQHVAAARLCADIARRHGFPGDWHRSSRLVGHEDVQPAVRHDKLGGWDPGVRRDRPYFDMELVLAALDLERP